MKIVRDSAVRQEPAQPQAVSPEENRFSIRPRQIALFFLWMLAFTLLARGTSGALLPEVQLSTPAPNTITQSLTATGTIQWAAGSLFYLPEGLLVEAVFVSEGEAVQEGDKIAALRREDVEQKLRSLQAELAQKQTEYARLTKPVAADSYDLEKAQQALQAAYQAAENSAAAWAEKEANAGSERDALQRELNERQEKAAQYAREIAEKQAQRELLQQEESPDEEIISRIEAELTQLTAEETQNREALAEAEARLNEADAALESVQSQREEAARTAAQAAEQAEQARNDARHAYEKSVEAASETAAANAASATVLAEQIREMESSVETLKKLDEQEGVFCAPQTGTVDTGSLYDFVTDRYTDADGKLFTLPARFTVPVMHGAAGTLDGVSTLDDVAALVQQYAPRPAEASWAPLDESQRYALGFDSVDSLVQFALQTSQPALFTADGLDEAKLRDLMAFLQMVGEDYNMADYPEQDTMSGTAGNFGGLDTIVWYAGMSEYAQTSRAVFGYGSMTTPSWLGATDSELRASGQTILQPGLCQGVYLPSCFAAVSANSDQTDYAGAFLKALFSDEVQGSFQEDGMPVTKAGMQISLDRNMPAMQDNGYTGGFEELLAQLSTPVVVDEALQDSLIAHTKALLSGSETMDQAVEGVVGDLSLRFAEQG